MKIGKYIGVILLAGITLTSCENYFETNPGTSINDEDYLGQLDQMYTGYMGVLSAMQDAGDDMLFVSDIRMDYLEPTLNAGEDIRQLYNYQAISPTNELANPDEVYSVILACNDYLSKMRMFKNDIGDAISESNEVNYNALVSSTIRVKVWAYFQLGKIYGEALYFDDPVKELKDVLDTGTFEHLSTYEAVVDKCLNLLDSGDGKDGITGSLTEMDWAAWLDPDGDYGGDTGTWGYIDVDYDCLRSELLLAKNEGYEWIRDRMLQKVFDAIGGNGEATTYLLNANYGRLYSDGRMWGYGAVNSMESLSSIVYSYQNEQTNELFDYFGMREPNRYLLRPSTYGMSKYESNDNRRTFYMRAETATDTVMAKYHLTYGQRSSVQSDMSVVIYRGTDIHFLLAEAENHLGNWEQAYTLLNDGFMGNFPYGFDYNSETEDVTRGYHWGDERYNAFNLNRYGYRNAGIRGVHGLPADTLTLRPTDEGYNQTEEERIKAYDLALLDNYLLEFAGEGKSIGIVVRMARRYNDWSIAADRIAPKYPTAQQAAIHSQIASGDFFIDWDLFNE